MSLSSLSLAPMHSPSYPELCLLLTLSVIRLCNINIHHNKHLCSMLHHSIPIHKHRRSCRRRPANVAVSIYVWFCGAVERRDASNKGRSICGCPRSCLASAVVDESTRVHVIARFSHSDSRQQQTQADGTRRTHQGRKLSGIGSSFLEFSSHFKHGPQSLSSWLLSLQPPSNHSCICFPPSASSSALGSAPPLPEKV